MRLRNLKPHRGDTLIEVIFAFAILGTIIGFAYTGVIQGRKTAVAARQRTQALLIAQYQARALGAYRASLPWDSSGGTPNVIGGGSPQNAAIVLVTSAGDVTNFCLRPVGQKWSLINIASGGTNCDAGLADELPAPNAGSVNQTVKIRTSFTGFASTNLGSGPNCYTITTCPLIRAEVGVYWTDPFGVQSSVKDFVILNRGQ